MNRKIYILSENTDRTTTDVMSWLSYYGYTSYRINIDDKSLSILFISGEQMKIKTDFCTMTIYPNDYVWARRFGTRDIFVTKEHSNTTLQTKIFEFTENRDVWKSMYYWISHHCKYCVNPFSYSVNKIDVLEYAKELNIQTPYWILTNQKDELLSAMNGFRYIAVKSFNTLFYRDRKNTIKSITKRMSYKQLNNLPSQFQTMIFQEYIEKKYELRSFLFDGHFYTMAIFSQKDKKTQIDFRNYNHQKPNMVCPYQMPKQYEKKLIELSKKLNLFSGSFDILVDKNDTFFFLEVNPIGQFGMVSYPCNYLIEKTIAEYIIKQINL